MIYIAFTYLLINAFLTGSLWDDIKIHEYYLRSVSGFILNMLIFLLLALPIYIISEIVEFIEYKINGKGIDSANFLYVISKQFDNVLKIIKRLTSTK